MSDNIYILNVNPGGLDIIHARSGLTERCNTDQVKGRQTIDPDTADALLNLGEARRCEHCNQGDPE